MKTLSLCFAFAVAVMTVSTAGSEEAKGYVQPPLTHPAFGNTRIVVPVTSADPDIWKFKMANIDNAISAIGQWGGKPDIKVVLYGTGIELLRSEDAVVRKMIAQMRATGVRVLVCNNSLRHMNIDYRTLPGVDAADVVPSGFLEVAWLQQAQGYSVDPVN
jgi:intracellular sulfur oxidation DsrE/DsrF family protein